MKVIVPHSILPFSLLTPAGNGGGRFELRDVGHVLGSSVSGTIIGLRTNPRKTPCTHFLCTLANNGKNNH